MGIKKLYNAQKNKKNITKGAKDLQQTEKLSKKAIEEIDTLLSIIDNVDIKEDLLSLKTMISIDLSSGDNIAISNYLFGRLFRTHVTAEYTVLKKKFQLGILANDTLISKNTELTSLYETTQDILSMNVKIARNLLGLTQTYATANKDLLPRNQKEFDLYVAEYDTYISQRFDDIKTKFAENNFKENLNEDMMNTVKELFIELNPSFIADSLDDIEKLINTHFTYELKVSTSLLKVKNLKKDEEENKIFDALYEIILDYNRVAVMILLNIFKVQKPFNDKYTKMIEEFDLNEKVKTDFTTLTEIYTEVLNNL